MENINNSANTVGIDQTLDNLNASGNQLNLSGGEESAAKPEDLESSI